MKIIFYLFAAVLMPVVSTFAQASTGGEASEGQLMLADPFVLEDEGWFYIYGTHADDGIVVYRSRDLKNWSDLCGNAADGLALHKDDVWGDGWFWAPEVYKVGSRYIMTYSAEEHICYAESDSPCGPFVQREKRPYLSEKGIDSSIFIDTNGNAYMFWVRFTGGNVIWVAEMTPDLHEVKIETARKLIDVTDGTWEHAMGRVAEGPMTVKLGGKYYLTFSCNDYRSQDYAVGYAVADNIFGPYTRYEGNPILHRYLGYYGTGHHAILHTSKGQYYMVFHAHKSADEVGPRQTLIAPLKFVRVKGDAGDKSGDKSGGKSVKSDVNYRLEVSDKLIVPMIGSTK